MENDIMNAFLNPSENVISVFTLALLKDTNFYAEVDLSKAQNIFWGKNKGCQFLNN